jgi:hypothetical protein
MWVRGRKMEIDIRGRFYVGITMKILIACESSGTVREAIK